MKTRSHQSVDAYVKMLKRILNSIGNEVLFMEGTDILERLGKKEVKAEDVAKKAIENPSLLPEIFKGVSSTNARIRYGCAKILRIVSEEDPEKLYPKMDFFIELLDSDKRILKWNALYIIANLTTVDVDNRFEDVFDKYYSLLGAEYMVTVANVVGNSGKIAKAKPNLTRKITNELLKTENLTIKSHLTQECKNIIIGHSLSAFDMYFDQIQNKDEVISFAKRQLSNTRNATRVEAEKFLAKFT